MNNPPVQEITSLSSDESDQTPEWLRDSELPEDLPKTNRIEREIIFTPADTGGDIDETPVATIGDEDIKKKQEAATPVGEVPGFQPVEEGSDSLTTLADTLEEEATSGFKSAHGIS